jgi:NAD+ synthetase
MPEQAELWKNGGRQVRQSPGSKRKKKIKKSCIAYNTVSPHRLARTYRGTYNSPMRLGIVQINPQVGAIDQNLRAMLSYIDKARRSGCELVVFPELSLCGYFPLDLLWRSGFLAQSAEALQQIVRASRQLGIIVGGVSYRTRREGENLRDPSSVTDGAGYELRNTAFLAADGALIGEEVKLYLPSFDVFSEPRYFTPGEGAEVFDFREQKLGVSICEDLWVDEGPTDVQASLGADLIVNISASPFFAGKAAIRRRLAAKRSQENEVTLVYVNRVGGQDDIVYDGGSFITGAEGTLLFQAPYFQEGLFVVDLKSLKPIPTPNEDNITLIRDAIVLGIRDYVKKNGFSRVIIGLSGGIDSSLLAVLATEALGPDAVAGVSLPSAITAPENRQDAREIARRLSIEFLEIPIENVVTAHRKALPRKPEGVVDENLQARTRGTLLMALANERNALVLAPGNKSEIAMGYNTLYGDTVGALAPLADLYKTEVYELAETMGDRIPQRIKEKLPTAELRPGQRDEDDLPPYAVLDPLLRELIEKNASHDALIEQGFPKETVDEVLTRYYRSEYKRQQLPPGIKVSPKAFGSGRRMPITHSYRN